VLPLVGFRWVVGCHAATLLITWPLWQMHRAPPMLPAAAPPAVGLGWRLLLSLVGGTASSESAAGGFRRMDETYMCPTMRSGLVCLVVPMLDSDDEDYRSS
jgi:hypothetical protein